MLTHQCAECGKKLSGSAAACPKCGAQKPSNGWEKANNRPWEIVKILLGIGVVWFCGNNLYQIVTRPSKDTTPVGVPEVSTAPATPPASAAEPTVISSADLKIGTLFYLDTGKKVICRTPEQLGQIPALSSKGDQASADKSFSEGKCRTDFPPSETEMVDSIQYVDGIKYAIVGFHAGNRNSQNWDYTLISSITPAVSPVSSEPYKKTPHITIAKSDKSLASPLKKGQFFYLNPKTPFACAGIDPLEGLYKYASKNDLTNFNRLLVLGGKNSGCYGHLPDNVQWKVDSVENVKRMADIDEDVVFFHPASMPRGSESYATLIEFVDPSSISPAPTPSAAN